MTLPYSQACENNKGYILPVISEVFREGDLVLEIGSGTTQHIRFFARELPAITWQPSDMESGLATVQAGLQSEQLENIRPAVALDVRLTQWPVELCEGVFSANTLHIMSQACVEKFFAGVGRILKPGGAACVYGPFKYRQAFTSNSNAEFDLWLKARDPESGVRDIEAVEQFARDNGLELEADHNMPANNQLLVWRKRQ